MVPTPAFGGNSWSCEHGMVREAGLVHLYLCFFTYYSLYGCLMNAELFCTVCQLVRLTWLVILHLFFQMPRQGIGFS